MKTKMKMSGRSSQPVVLQARPVRAPNWWPKAGCLVRWASCDRDGGYVIGLDPSRAVPRQDVMTLKEDWRAEHDGRAWQFRTQAVTRKKR